MSWLGDLLQFDKSNFSEIWKDVKDKPQKALLGAMDPVGGKFWATLTGDESYNETPLNLLGGPSGTTWLDPWQPRNGRDMYSRAEALSAAVLRIASSAFLRISGSRSLMICWLRWVCCCTASTATVRRCRS